MTKAVWILINPSHYHVIRAKAFNSKKDIELQIIQLRNVDADFPELLSQNFNEIKLHTIFSGDDYLNYSKKYVSNLIFKKLNEINPDIVLVNGWSIGGSTDAICWSALNNKKSIILSESNVFDFQRNFFKEWIKKRIISYTHGAIVGGINAFEYIHSLGMPKSLIVNYLNIVDNFHFSKKTKSYYQNKSIKYLNKKKVFLSAGRFIEKKNHLNMMRAFLFFLKQKNFNSEWVLIILGDGPLMNKYQSFIKKNNLKDFIFLKGSIKYTELPMWYQRADCFIHPSKTEQWGLVINEAMSAGCPILASNMVGSSKSLVQESINGFLFEPLSIESILSKLNLISKLDTMKLNQMGNQSLVIIKNYNQINLSKNFSKLLDKIKLIKTVSKISFFDYLIFYFLRGR